MIRFSLNFRLTTSSGSTIVSGGLMKSASLYIISSATIFTQRKGGFLTVDPFLLYIGQGWTGEWQGPDDKRKELRVAPVERYCCHCHCHCSPNNLRNLRRIPSQILHSWPSPGYLTQHDCQVFLPTPIFFRYVGLSHLNLRLDCQLRMIKLVKLTTNGVRKKLFLLCLLMHLILWCIHLYFLWPSK